jgi:glutaredoxin 3
MKSVEIYTGRFCGHCILAKQLLANKGVSFIEHSIGHDSAKRAEMMQRAMGRRSVPQVFIGDFHIGGFQELAALDRAGKLEPMLAN